MNRRSLITSFVALLAATTATPAVAQTLGRRGWLTPRFNQNANPRQPSTGQGTPPRGSPPGGTPAPNQRPKGPFSPQRGF